MPSKQIEYYDGDVRLRGELFRGGSDAPSPGILVVHAARGLDDETRRRAEMVAKLGNGGAGR